MTEDQIACPACGTTFPVSFKFCADCGQRLGGVAPPPPVDVTTDERRDVTVLFADVSGFTAMSERLDPETVHRIMNDCFDGLGVAIADEGGHIDKYIGDNVMALFGAPVAHADDPARAARAALSMQAYLADFADRNRERAGVIFRMRIGIHCGVVLAGRVGASTRRDYSVMGDVVNLASRLESNAAPGTILVSHEMMRRLRGQFAFGPVRRLDVKGKTGQVIAHELLRELTDAPDPFDEWPFVGRADALARLTGNWRSGALPMRAIVCGPSGIGKTRLVRTAAASAGMRLLPVSARPATRRRPLALVRRIVQSVRAHVSNTPVPRSFEAFTADLAPLTAGLDPYLGALWYLAAPDTLAVRPPDPDPRTLRRTLGEGFGRLLANLRRHDDRLVLFLDSFDDCDEASALLLHDLPEADTEPLPPIVTAVRAAPSPAAPDDVLVVQLPPLTPCESEQLLDRLDYAQALSPALREDVLRRAEGIPLYLREMLLKLVDAGVLRRSGAEWESDPTASAVILPESLFGALVARADALEPRLKRLLLECAVQGPEFDAAVTAAVAEAARGETADTGESLRRLAERDLVEQDPSQAGRWYFRQTLMQAACYETLLLSERRRLHRETGLALAATAGGVEAVAPELLALHFEAAEAWADAAAANVRAGIRAAGLFANADAGDRFAKAIAQSASAGGPAAATAFAAHDAAARLRLRLGAYDEVEQHAASMAMHADGPAQHAAALRHLAAACASTGRAEAAAQHLTEAVAMLDEHNGGHVEVLRDLYFDLAHVELRAARLSQALDHAARSRRLCDPSDRPALVRLDILDGRLAHTGGRFAEAAAHFRAALAAAEVLGSLSEQARACNYMGDAARDVGNYEDADQLFRRALELWRRIGDAEGVAGAQNNLANLAMSRGDLEGAAHRHRLALHAFEEIGNVNGAALARANLAILALENGRPDEAIAEAGRSLALLDDLGTALLHALTRVVLGEGHLAAGAWDEAERVFRGVLDSEPPPLAVAGAERGLGRIALARGDAGAARERLEIAFAAFGRLERKQEAARTLLDLAEARHRLGQIDEARDTVASAIEGFDRLGATADAARARSLALRLRQTAADLRS
ncbi:adenylate cyclase [Constrictibacter sp. MBR-5]|jgi:class 3 adenylate cyclase/tetratricopeptide (TPR) repeat protein